MAVWAGGDGRLVYDGTRRAYVGGQDVPGLGDRAWVIGGGDNFINVQKGDVYLRIGLDYDTLPDAERVARLIAIARTAVGRF